MKRLFAALALLAVACADPPALDRAKAKGMIEASLAFQAPLDEDLRKLDPRFGADPYMKRELLKVEVLTTKPDGPFGMAGQVYEDKLAYNLRASIAAEE